MKILWLVNFEIPMLGNREMVKEGWITGMLTSLLKYHPDIEITILYPQNRTEDNEVRNTESLNSIGYFRNWDPTKYNPALADSFSNFLKNAAPDIIHVMGTEFPHTLSMCEACLKEGMTDRLVISIQGITKLIADAYDTGLPCSVKHGYRLKDIKNGNLNKDKKRFEARAAYETEALRLTRNVVGRTEFDETYVRNINKDIRYFHNNEVLRPSFYGRKWKYENCEPNTVFVSQCDYPIKGMHILIEGAHHLKEMGHTVKYRIAGWNILNSPEWKMSKYVFYLHSLMKKYDLYRDFEFLNPLDEGAMVKEYLRANIYVLPSVIENSPNSLGEAMILGMPVVASDVGGVKDFVDHGRNGYVFPVPEPYKMACCIRDYMQDRGLSTEMGRNAAATAGKLYDRKNNADRLADIYKEMLNETVI
jgi:glycosyltransferase involved in cell wall biosynthesis